MGLLTDLIYRDKEARQYGWTTPFRDLADREPAKSISLPETLPTLELPPVQDFLSEEIGSEEPIEAARPNPKPQPFNPPSHQAADEVQTERTLVEEVKGIGFRTRVMQEGRTFYGTVEFSSGAPDRRISLVSESLGHLRMSLVTFGAQGVTARDIAADSEMENDVPSNTNPSFGFRNGQ